MLPVGHFTSSITYLYYCYFEDCNCYYYFSFTAQVPRIVRYLICLAGKLPRYRRLLHLRRWPNFCAGPAGEPWLSSAGCSTSIAGRFFCDTRNELAITHHSVCCHLSLQAPMECFTSLQAITFRLAMPYTSTSYAIFAPLSSRLSARTELRRAMSMSLQTSYWLLAILLATKWPPRFAT